MKVDLGLQDAKEMRRRALDCLDGRQGEERRKVTALIVNASSKGGLSVTFYDPISDALVKELGEMGYNVNARSSQGRNETEWNVTISWDRPYGRSEPDRANFMPRD